jgi:hypothetical protein
VHILLSTAFLKVIEPLRTKRLEQYINYIDVCTIRHCFFHACNVARPASCKQLIIPIHCHPTFSFIQTKFHENSKLLLRISINYQIKSFTNFVEVWLLQTLAKIFQQHKTSSSGGNPFPNFTFCCKSSRKNSQAFWLFLFT